jgi:hypothetical protein
MARRCLTPDFINDEGLQIACESLLVVRDIIHGV